MAEILNIPQSAFNSINKIEGNLSTAKSKIADIRNNVKVVSPGSEISIKLKELEIKKITIEPLNYQKQLFSLDLKVASKIITQGEYDVLKGDLSKSLSDNIASIDDEIAKLQHEIDLNKTEKEKLKQEKSKRKKSYDSVNLIRVKKTVLAEKDRLKNSIKTLGPQAIVIVLSYLVNAQTTRLTKEVTNLELLVDKTNAVIDNIKTQQDVANARILRNRALILLTNCENKLRRIKKIVDVVAKVLQVMNIVILALQAIATLAPIPAVRAIASAAVSKFLPIVSGLATIVASVSRILESLLARILDARARLKNIDDILNNKIESNTFDNTKITNNYGKLGLIIGADYLGFKFVIKEESNTTVKGIKRRYAVAVNKDGNEVVKSQASFTLDPDVLIEELKLIIDQRNLQA